MSCTIADYPKNRFTARVNALLDDKAKGEKLYIGIYKLRTDSSYDLQSLGKSLNGKIVHLYTYPNVRRR